MDTIPIELTEDKNPIVVEFNRQIVILRTELKNIRANMQGLKRQHQKEVLQLKEKIDELENCKSIPLQNYPSKDHKATTIAARPEHLIKTNTGLKSPRQLTSTNEENTAIVFHPIGLMTDSWFNTKNGTPRQPSVCRHSKGTIDINDMQKNFPNCKNPQYALENLTEFSYIWIIFLFNLSKPKGDEITLDYDTNTHFTKTKIAPPRLKGQRVGLFSTRSPHRPNLVGLTLAKLESINGTKLNVSGIDILKGTPILDIKPYIPLYDVPPVLVPAIPIEGQSSATTVTKELQPEENTSSQKDINNPLTKQMVDSKHHSDIKIPEWINTKRLQVVFTNRSLEDIDHLMKKDNLEVTKLGLLESIRSVLQADPRSNYRREKCSDRLYYFSITTSIHVTAWFDEVINNGNLGCEPETIAEVLKVSFSVKN